MLSSTSLDSRLWSNGCSGDARFAYPQYHLRMKTTLKACVTLLTLLFCSLNLHASDTRNRDGNLWRTLTAEQKLTYIAAFWDGMELGHEFDLFDLVNRKEKAACAADADKSFNTYTDKYAKNVTTVQIVDGLNTFYADYRNRSIPIHGGVWIVLNSIAGTPQETLDKMTEVFRKTAASSER